LQELEKLTALNQVHRVDYESLKSEFSEEIQKIGSFINEDLSICFERGVNQMSGRLGDPSFRQIKSEKRIIKGISYWDKRVMSKYGISAEITNITPFRFILDMADYYVGKLYNIYKIFWQKKYL